MHPNMCIVFAKVQHVYEGKHAGHLYRDVAIFGDLCMHFQFKIYFSLSDTECYNQISLQN